MLTTKELPTIPHAGALADAWETPRYLLPDPSASRPNSGLYSCAFCGVGDSGRIASPQASGSNGGLARLSLHHQNEPLTIPALVAADGSLEVVTQTALTEPAGMLVGELDLRGEHRSIHWREVDRRVADDGVLFSQRFAPPRSEGRLEQTTPTAGCVKFKLSMLREEPAFPIHTAPSVLDGDQGRRSIAYEEAVRRLADLLLEHRAGRGRTLVYACGQIDYFTIFAIQEVFRLLGVRNLTGNAEHCLNAGAVHNELLTGQEGPFLTVSQAVTGPERFYLMNGWNGSISHPPAFQAILKREPLDAYLIEVMETESARTLARKLGPDRVLYIRPGSDPHLALAVAHAILSRHPERIEARFIKGFADRTSFGRFLDVARAEHFEPRRVAERIAPEPELVEPLLRGILGIAERLSRPESIPINIPSVGLSQTSGVVAHCLWGNVFAMLGKFGLRPDGTPAGGVLRLPGQINAETEVQGLSRKYFMGRIPIEQIQEAAQRMGLPEDAYAAVLDDTPRTALDYSDPTELPELFICLGTQFEANMMNRRRWLKKLEDPKNTLVVIDPIPDPYSLRQADLIIPSPPHPATTKLYQNGEWKLSLSIPQKRAAPETRSDATILYDAMAAIAQRLNSDPALAAAHPDLARHCRSGYLERRYGRGLKRIDGEVSRPQLWRRIQDYMAGGSGPLYCRPEHADGTPIRWEELLDKGSVIYGGVGATRFVLDYGHPEHHPFRDIYRQPRRFAFFVPTGDDLATMPAGIVLNSGRSCLSDDPERIRFATSTFNSGKATPIRLMPEENPLYVSKRLAATHGLATGDRVRVTGCQSGGSVVLPVVVSDRVKGECVYTSFHKSRAQIDQGVYLNDVTSHEARCAYTAQTRVKATPVTIERVAARQPDISCLNQHDVLPVWSGQSMPSTVSEILRETQDVYTFRLQGDPLCRFVYQPGQFCTLVLTIGGKRVLRSYTISSTPTRPFVIEITVKRVPGGLVSNWLCDHLKVGDRIECLGPSGRFALVPGQLPRKVLLLGAGSGITPLMAMIRWLTDVSAAVDVRLLYSVRSPDDVIFRREIDALAARHPRFVPTVVATQAGGTGISGRINRAMLELVAPDLHERDVFLCGPQGFMAAATALLEEAKFDPARLHRESFGAGNATAADHPEPRSAPGLSTRSIKVEFARSGKTVMTDGRTSFLELAEEHRIPLDSSCRSGDCGACKCRLLQGQVQDPGELAPEERAQGYVLSCMARPTTDCVVAA